MSTEHTRNKGRLFANADKKKPSQPDLRGNGAIDGVTYDISAWRRDDEVSLRIAPTRSGNAYPPDAFRGELHPTPGRGGRDDEDAAEVPAWTGTIEGDEQSYAVRAFQKQGKSGPYLNLFFELTEPEPV